MLKLNKVKQFQTEIRSIWPNETVHVEFRFGLIGSYRNRGGWYLSRKNPVTGGYVTHIGSDIDEANEWLERFVGQEGCAFEPVFFFDQLYWKEVSCCEYRYLGKAVRDVFLEICSDIQQLAPVNYKVSLLLDEYPVFAVIVDDAIAALIKLQ